MPSILTTSIHMQFATAFCLAVGIHFSDHCLCGEAAVGDGNIKLNVWTACRDKKPSSDHCREELHSGKIDTLCKKTH